MTEDLHMACNLEVVWELSWILMTIAAADARHRDECAVALPYPFNETPAIKCDALADTDFIDEFHLRHLSLFCL